MLDQPAFLQFVAPRIHKWLTRLQGNIWQIDPKPLPVKQTTPTREHLPIREGLKQRFRKVTKTPLFWGEMFDQCFWQIDLTGRTTKGKYLYWADRGEATMYVGEMPVAGFDPGHYYQPVPPRAKLLSIESVCCRTGVWVPGEHQGISTNGSEFEGAFLADRDELHWTLSLDVEVLLDIAMLCVKRSTGQEVQSVVSPFGYRPPIDTAEPLAKMILTRLNEAVDVYERGDAAAALRVTQSLLKDLAGQADEQMKVILTGHAHIDLVWLWPENVAEFKATHSFANALNLMDTYPEFVFGYSQPASYDAIDRRTPKLMKQINHRAQQSRFEHAGATYVESDTQLACGEALLRAFELGQQDCLDRFGETNRVLWIPDVFGYAACIPQLMAGFGVDYFYTTKQHWSSATQFPYSSFRWRGHDGTEVLTHVSYSHYNQDAKPEMVKFFSDQHRQAGVHDQALMPTGYGDGGGGTNAQMCERARRIKNIAGLPQVEWGRIDQFFDHMAERRDELPVWQGEIYLEYHRGVQTTHGRLKDAFRAAERGLQVWEAAHAYAGLGPIDSEAWKRVVFAQFHDYIPGSSIKRVYDEAIPELEAIAKRGYGEAKQVLQKHTSNRKIGKKKNAKTEKHIFNPLPMPITSIQGKKLYQVPAFSLNKVADLDRITDEVSASEKHLKNSRVDARFNNRGEITKLIIDGQPVAIADRQALGQLWTFPDRPAVYDAWDIDRTTLSNGTHEKQPAQKKVSGTFSDTTLTVSFTRSIGQHSTITVHYRLDAQSPILRVTADLDWQDKQTLLKFVCPTDYMGKNARYGAPFGSQLRPQLPGPLATDAQFENPGSRWACVSDDTENDGLMLITQSRYGFGCLEGRLHLSLIRSAAITPVIGSAEADTTSMTIDAEQAEISDLGQHTIPFALGHFTANNPQAAQPAALAETLFTQPILANLSTTKLNHQLPQIETDTSNASYIPVHIKPINKNTCLLRINETLGQRGQVLVTPKNEAKVVLSNLLGESQNSPQSKLRVTYKPYDLNTLTFITLK